MYKAPAWTGGPTWSPWIWGRIPRPPLCHGAWLAAGCSHAPWGAAGSGPGKAGTTTGWGLAVPNQGHCSSSCSKGSSPLILKASMNQWHYFPSDRPVLLFTGLNLMFSKVLFFLLCCTWGILNSKEHLIIHMYDTCPKSSVIAYGKVTTTANNKYLHLSLFFNIIRQWDGNGISRISFIETLQIYGLTGIHVIMLGSYLQWNPISKWIILVFEQNVWWFAFFPSYNFLSEYSCQRELQNLYFLF